MNSEEAIKIAKEVAKEFEKTDFTESMYIIGSLANGHFDKFSDIDTMITTNRKVSKKDVLPIVKKFMTKKDYEMYNSVTEKQFPYRIDPKINGIEVMLFFILEEWILSGIKASKNPKKHEYEKQKDNMRNKQAIILFDKKNKFRNLVKNIQELPLDMKKHVLYERIHYLNHLLFIDSGAINMAIKRKNFLEAQALIIDAINDNIYKCIYALNGKTKVDRKWGLADIKNFKKKPKNIVNKLNSMIKMGNTKEGMGKKIEILRKITRELKSMAEKQGIKDLPNLEALNK